MKFVFGGRTHVIHDPNASLLRISKDQETF